MVQRCAKYDRSPGQREQFRLERRLHPLRAASGSQRCAAYHDDLPPPWSLCPWPVSWHRNPRNLQQWPSPAISGHPHTTPMTFDEIQVVWIQIRSMIYSWDFLRSVNDKTGRGNGTTPASRTDRKHCRYSDSPGNRHMKSSRVLNSLDHPPEDVVQLDMFGSRDNFHV